METGQNERRRPVPAHKKIPVPTPKMSTKIPVGYPVFIFQSPSLGTIILGLNEIKVSFYIIVEVKQALNE